MQLTPFISQKFKFYSFVSMFLLVFVHGYNLNQTYLQPFTTVSERLTFTSFTEYLLANGLFRFRIPMLFAISGYLYAMNDGKNYGERTRKRLGTLLLPYLIWSAIGLFITYLWQQFPITAEAVSKARIDQLGDNRPYLEIGSKGIFTRWIFYPISFQLWFIRVLLVYNLLYPCLRWLLIKMPTIWFIIASLLWLTSAGFYFADGEGLLFFTLGIWLCKQNNYLDSPPKWINLDLMWLLYIGLGISKTWLAFNLHSSLATAIILILLYKVVVCSGLLSIWFGCDKLVRFCMEKRWFIWLSSFSFIIYALHVPLLNYSSQLVFMYFSKLPAYRLVAFILVSLSIITFCILIGWLLRTLIPKAYFIFTGGRGG